MNARTGRARGRPKYEPRNSTQFEDLSKEAIRANTILNLVDMRDRCATPWEREAIDGMLRVLQCPECD